MAFAQKSGTTYPQASWIQVASLLGISSTHKPTHVVYARGIVSGMLINFNAKIDTSGTIHAYYATDSNNTSRLGSINYLTIVYTLR